MERLEHLERGVVTTSSRPLIIGHRGASGHELENSRPAFVKAMSLGADGAECDIRATQDGKLVVFHDESLLRLAGLPERLNRLTLADIQKRVRMGESEEPIMTLEELCQMPELAGAWLFIELKELRLETEAIRLIQKYRDPSLTILGSFHLETLRALAGLSYPLPLLLAEIFGALSSPTHISHAGLLCDAVDPLRVAELHRRQVRVWTWTVNESDEIQRVISCKVDGVITDYPDRVRRELDRLTRPLS